MTPLKNLTDQLPAIPSKHFCIAPFQSIRQNAYGRNSPCAFGAGEWHHGHLTPTDRWHSPELNELRRAFINDEKPATCHRCWSEEDSGKVSLRQRQYEYFPNDYTDFIRTGEWVSGPKTAVFKTSNVCNLACRSCGGWDTNTYTREGVHYAITYNTQELVNGVLKTHNRFIPLLPPKHMDFMNYEGIVENLEKIDFFGGEPFLNITQLDLLEYLVNKGLSKNITLFYSTNCTNHPTERLKRAWNNFKRIEISMSVDGIGDKFEYLRWPGRWDEAQEVILSIMNLKLDAEIYRMAGYTISTMNAYYADETVAWLKENIGDIYINMVNGPAYLAISTIPDYVKSVIRNNTSNSEVLGYLDIKQSDPVLWRQFIVWMKRQDLYRNQNFALTFPEFFEHIQADWDSITDLSETTFYSN
jgi:MoaA/NifB/PqqE/SkfB family radical SAM enzyme